MIRPLLLLLALPSPAFAHDLWLLPAGGSTVEIAQGMEFPLSDGAPKQASFEKLEVVAPDGTRRPLVWSGETGGKAVTRFEAKSPGLYIAAASTNAKSIELAAQEFNEYLVSDGLAHVWLERAKEQALDRPAKEKYQKWVKALVRTGEGPGDATRAIGHVLEIVPMSDPTKASPGGALEISVFFRGQPLPDARVGWDCEGDGAEPAGMVRTDARGRALIPIARSGRMALRLTHMTRPNEKGHEWASYWTTLTFIVR